MTAANCLVLLALTAQPEPPPTLSGPSVPDQRARTLLTPGIVREFTPIEGRPEIAAALLLDLDAETREAVVRISDDRMTELTLLLVDRIDDVRDITDAMTAGDAEAASDRLRQIWTEHDGDATDFPMLAALSAVLDDTQLAEVRQLSEAYMAAWVASEGGGDETRDRLRFLLFQTEIRRAYDASLSPTRQALEAIYEAVDPTPEQRATIRAIAIEHIRETRLEATPQQRRAVMRRIYDALDDDRQAKLFEYTMRIVLPGE